MGDCLHLRDVTNSYTVLVPEASSIYQASTLLLLQYTGILSRQHPILLSVTAPTKAEDEPALFASLQPETREEGSCVCTEIHWQSSAF